MVFKSWWYFLLKVSEGSMELDSSHWTLLKLRQIVYIVIHGYLKIE